MIVTGVNHYTIRAPADIIDACVSFYCNIMNLRIGFRPPEDSVGYWLYAGDTAIIHLYVSENEKTGVGSYLDHIAFTCVNLPVTIQRLEDLGIEYRANHLLDIDQFQLFIVDPAHNTVELDFDCERI